MVTKCTKEQKDIMIAFYNRQKTSQIKANPADVIQAMRAAGVSELKESQIKIGGAATIVNRNNLQKT